MLVTSTARFRPSRIGGWDLSFRARRTAIAHFPVRDDPSEPAHRFLRERNQPAPTSSPATATTCSAMRAFHSVYGDHPQLSVTTTRYGPMLGRTQRIGWSVLVGTTPSVLGCCRCVWEACRLDVPRKYSTTYTADRGESGILRRPTGEPVAVEQKQRPERGPPTLSISSTPRSAGVVRDCQRTEPVRRAQRRSSVIVRRAVHVDLQRASRRRLRASKRHRGRAWSSASLARQCPAPSCIRGAP